MHRMNESPTLLPKREALFYTAEHELHYSVEIYRLEDRFEGLTPELAAITMLDVTKIPGCHYGLKNVFVPLIHQLEIDHSSVSPQTAILVEPSTGNGWVAFSDAAAMLGYEHVVVMPDGLPEGRFAVKEELGARELVGRQDGVGFEEGVEEDKGAV